MSNKKIAIIGYGELGKAIHKALGNKKDLFIEIWDKKDQENKLSGVISLAEVVFLCVPSWCAREVLRNIKKYLAKKTLVVCMAKGMEPSFAPDFARASTGKKASENKSKTLKTMDMVLQDELLSGQPLSILSGPMLAEELMAGKNGFAVMAVKNKKHFMVVSDIFNGTNLKIKYSNDLRGVALCGVFKNIYSMGLGMCDGLNLGSNTKGKLTAEAIEEMAKIVKYFGGKRESVFGESGAADLIATAFSSFSRNREVGEELAKTGVCCLESEGFKSVDSASKLLGKRADSLPFFNVLKLIILENQKPSDVFKNIL